jgi:Flp pilus assembly protein TadD
MRYNVLDKFENAVLAFRRASELNPEDTNIWCNLGVVLSTLGEIEQAEHALKKAIEIRPDNFVGWLNLISHFQKQGRSKEADEAHKSALDIITDFDYFMEDLQESIDEARDQEP